MQVYNINKVYKISLITIFIIGIFLRLFLLFQNNSMFYDEVVLMLNILNKRYIELLGHLDYYQVAPPLFLLATKLLVNIFKTSNLYLQDLIPKLIPFISGILSILAFYKFINLVNKNKFFIFISMFLFLFNPIIINYSVICKQYSIELLVSIILLSIFWRLIFDNISKSKYYIFIAFAPWLSFSSLFIIIPLSILLLFRNKKFFKNTIFSFSLSFVIYYVLYLQNILKQSYSGLNFCWASGGYFDFTHPTRLPIRLGALYSDEKSLALFCGCILLFALCLYLFSKNSILKKVYFLLPIIFTLLASAFHYYPLLARLLLFLVPIFIIFISMSNRFIILGFCTISLITYKKSNINTSGIHFYIRKRCCKICS